MFGWFDNESDKRDDLQDAREEYWQDPDRGKEMYDNMREASWADADEWERNLQRDEGTDD